MSLRVLFQSTLLLLIVWLAFPLVLRTRGYSGEIAVLATDEAALVLLAACTGCAALLLIALGQRWWWRSVFFVALLMACLFGGTLWLGGYWRSLIVVQAADTASLLWFSVSCVLTALTLYAASAHARRRLIEERTRQQMLALITEHLDIDLAVFDRRQRMRWRNTAGVGRFWDGYRLTPEIAGLIAQAGESGGRVSKSVYVSEEVRVNVQAITLGSEVALLTAPIRNEGGQAQFYERFIRRIVHDMRNPLAAVIAHASNIQASTASPESLVAAGIIEQEAQRLTRLVDSMLFDARLAYMPPVLETHDMADILEEVFFQHDELAMREGKRVQLDLLVQRAPLLCDRDLMVRALANLVDNALKYASSQVEVRLTLEATEQHYRIRIVDNGEGIPPEFLPDRIFQPLVRVRQRGAGSGLGLSIVKKIVELHQGNIQVTSIVDEGTTFTIWLPRSSASSSTALSA